MHTNTLIKAIGFNNQVRIYAINNTQMLRELHSVFPMKQTSAAAIGRTMAISSIMGSLLKNNETLKIKLESNGPIGYIYCESNKDGNVRAYIHNRDVYIKYNDGPKKGHLNVGEAVGKEGFLFVTKDSKLERAFSSSVPIQTGEIGDDFTYYFMKSEQTPSSVGVGVLVAENQEILVSGGFLIQLMPNTTDETIELVEQRLHSIPSVTSMLVTSQDPVDMIRTITNNQFKVLETLHPSYDCSCSKEYFYDKLMTLKKDELLEILTEDHKIEVMCQFCGKKYEYNENDFNL